MYTLKQNKKTGTPKSDKTYKTWQNLTRPEKKLTKIEKNWRKLRITWQRLTKLEKKKRKINKEKKKLIRVNKSRKNYYNPGQRYEKKNFLSICFNFCSHLSVSYIYIKCHIYMRIKQNE